MEIKGSKYMNVCMPLAVQFMGQICFGEGKKNRKKKEKQYG